MKIKINGEFTKEELQEKLKEFDKPVWEVRADGDWDICLYKDNILIGALLHKNKGNHMSNLSTVSRDIASAMGDLAETKDVLDGNKDCYYLYYDIIIQKWVTNVSFRFAHTKHFKTLETAKLATKLLNESEYLKEWIKRMCE